MSWMNFDFKGLPAGKGNGATTGPGTVFLSFSIDTFKCKKYIVDPAFRLMCSPLDGELDFVQKIDLY